MTIITITNMNTTPYEYFFSTDHQQYLPEHFVPVSYYERNIEEVRKFHSGEIELINPDYNFIPDYILEELTKS